VRLLSYGTLDDSARVIVRDVFGDGPLEVALADRDDPIEGLQHRNGTWNRALDTVIPTALNADDNLNHDQHDDRDLDL